MPKTEYLKDSYKSRLYIWVAMNVALFWALVIIRHDFSMSWTLLSSISIKDGIIGLITPIGAFVLDGLLSADAKARVAYWRYTHPLPGSRAFSEHLEKETRADPDRLVQQWGVFPDDPAEQNRLWYKIYRSVDSELRVHESHRAWLLARDLTGYSALFLFFLGIPAVVMDSTRDVAVWYLIALLAQYLLIMMAARNYGIRFVRTVLAVASNSQTPEDTTDG